MGVTTPTPPLARAGQAAEWTVAASIAADAKAVYEWLRAPDWSDDEFDFLAWVNSRPSHAARRVMLALGAKED